MVHALDWPRKHRNFYYPNDDNVGNWERLLVAGYAELISPPQLMPPRRTYRVSKKGIEFLDSLGSKTMVGH